MSVMVYLKHFSALQDWFGDMTESRPDATFIQRNFRYTFSLGIELIGHCGSWFSFPQNIRTHSGEMHCKLKSACQMHKIK